ncbi:MAG: DUF5915 domain-containing protein, partial [Clostridia bacterium]
QKRFPADFISEAVDQTRGWFYTLMAISTVLFDKAPFKNCIVMGHVGDKDGVKMSKHKGNVVAPNEALDSCGADAIRWYFYTSSAPWLPSRYYQEAVAEAQRKYMGTLWNTYAFFVLYANIDNFDPTKYDLKTVKLTLMDKWILSKLNTLIKEVDDGLTAYNITDSAKKISSFTDELSNWYVRRCRERFWGSGMTDDKIAAFKTLHEVLVNLAKVTAPFTPFIADELYQNLVRSVDEKAPISIHLTRYPTCDESMIDKSLEDGMEDVLDVVVLGRAGRNQANIKNRQPLAKMYFGGKEFDLSAELKSVIADELNVKTVEKFVSDEEFITYELKPQLRTLGKIYGKSINAIKEHLAHCDADSVVKLVRSGENYKFVVDGGVEVEVALDDLLVSSVNKPGFIAQSDKGVTVVLDTNLNDDLIAEGFERELVSKLQTMR